MSTGVGSPPGASVSPTEARHAAHFQALVEGSEDAILSKDRDGLITSWNPAAERLYGYTREEALGRSISMIIPPDHANEEKEILKRILAGERLSHYETERVKKNGERVAISLTVSPIRRADGEITGASVVARDMTERRIREQRVRWLQEITSTLARQAEPDRAIAVLLEDGARILGADAATVGLLDEGGERVLLVDHAGHSRDDLEEWQSFPVEAELPMCIAIREGRSIWSPSGDELRERFPLLAGAEIRFAALAVMPLAVQGNAIGAVSFSFTKPRQFTVEEKSFVGSVVQQAAYTLERARVHDAERQGRQRLAFLARASEVLNESLEVETTLRRLADLSVQHMSDWCSVDLVQPDGEVENVVIAHVDRSKIELVQEFRRRYPPNPDAPTGALRVIRTGEAELFSEVPQEMLVEAAEDEQHLEMMRALGLTSAIIVPLIARGRTLGAITFISSDRERTYGEEDLELAKDLARRAALAIDTVVLYQREHETALTLQRALLPGDLPQVEGMEVATRYLPAEAGLEVGGDWFDVTASGDGRVDVVIGDVAGRGVHAAAVMGRLAMALRAYVLDGRAPEAAVDGLDRLMKEFKPPQMATLFALSLDLSSGRARYVRAGHPPALLRSPEGEVVELGGEGSPPLGLIDGAHFAANEVTLDPDSTLLLYTDGLIERRWQDPQLGIEKLCDAFSEAPAAPQALVDHIPAALDAERVPDDIALLALRFGGTMSPREQ